MTDGQDILLRASPLEADAYTYSSLLHKLDQIFHPEDGEKVLKFTFTPTKGTFLRGSCKITNILDHVIKVTMHRSLAYVLGLGNLHDYIKSDDYVSIIFPPKIRIAHNFDLSRTLKSLTLKTKYAFVDEQELLTTQLSGDNFFYINQTDRFLIHLCEVQFKSRLVTLERKNIDLIQFTLVNIFGDIVLCDFAELIVYFFCK